MPPYPVTRPTSFPASPVGALSAPGYGYAEQAAFGPLLGMAVKQLPGMAGGLLAGELFESMTSGPAAGGATPMFKPTATSARPMFFRVPNPVTGQDVWFRPAGRPILWSGDLSACKRVKKVARRASRKR
jgi:hypothetical protein